MPFWPILRPILGAVRAGGLSGSGLARCGHSVGILRLLGHQCRQGCRNRRHRTSLWTDGRISRSGLFIRASRVAEVNNPLADARHGGHCKTAKGGNPYAPLCKPAFGLGWRADTAWIRCGRSAGFWFGCCGLSRGRLVELPPLVVPGLNTKLCTSGPATLVLGGNSRPRNHQAGGAERLLGHGPRNVGRGF